MQSPQQFELEKDDAPNDFLGISKAEPTPAQRFVIDFNYQAWLRQHLEEFRPGEFVNRKYNISYTPDRGYALFAIRNIRPGDTILRVPRSIKFDQKSICPQQVPNPLCSRLNHRVVEESEQGTSKLLAKLLQETYFHNHPVVYMSLMEIPLVLALALIKFCKSCKRDPVFSHLFHWEQYVAHLRVDVSVPMCSFTPSQMRDEGLPSGIVDMIRQQRRAVKLQYEFVMALLADGAQHLAPGEDELYEDEWLQLPHFFWALCHVNSRILGDSLMPILDALNHDSRMHNTGQKSFPNHHDLQSVSASYEPGEEVTFCYFQSELAQQNEGVLFLFGMLDTATPCVYMSLRPEDMRRCIRS